MKNKDDKPVAELTQDEYKSAIDEAYMNRIESIIIDNDGAITKLILDNLIDNMLKNLRLGRFANQGQLVFATIAACYRVEHGIENTDPVKLTVSIMQVLDKKMGDLWARVKKNAELVDDKAPEARPWVQ